MKHTLVIFLFVLFLFVTGCSSNSDNDPVDGDQVDGDQTDGDQTDGDQTDGDQTDGDQVDGDQADGDQTDGDQTDGDQVDGDQTDGDQVDGDQTDGDQTDGDQVDGDQVDGDQVDGDQVDGDADPEIDADPDFNVDGDYHEIEWNELPLCDCFTTDDCCDGCWPINEGGSCNDGNPDTEADTCSAGLCTGCDPAIGEVNHVAEAGGSPMGLALSGNLMYGSTWLGTGGFIANIANVEHPYLVSSLKPDPISTTSFNGSGIKVYDNRAYLMGSYNGIYIFDVSDPTAPVQTSRLRRSIEGSGYVPYHDVIKVGDIHYFASAQECIDIWDIDDEGNAEHLVQFTNDEANPYCSVTRLMLENNKLYAAAGNLGFLIVDVSDPETPTKLDAYTQPVPDENFEYYDANGFDKIGDTVFVTYDELGLLALNVADPSNITELGRLALTGYGQQVKIVGTTAFVAIRDIQTVGKIRIVDISDPANMSIQATIVLQDQPKDLWIRNNRLFVADTQAGVKIYNIETLTAPVQLGMFSIPNHSNAIAAAAKDKVYVGGVNNWIWGMDLSNPARATTFAAYLTNGDIADIITLGNHLYVGTSGGINVLQASAQAITSVQNVGLGDNIERMQLQFPYLYVAVANAGFAILEFMNDSVVPTLRASEDLGNVRIESVAVANDVLFACSTSGSAIQAYDISDLSDLQSVGSLWYSCRDLATVAGQDILYIAEGVSGLRVLDVSDASSPVAGLLDSGITAERLTISGGRLYVSGGSDVVIYDISETPLNPTKLDTIPMGVASVYDFAQYGNHGFVACGSDGLKEVNLNVCYE